MSEPSKSPAPSLLSDALRAEIKALVVEALREANGNHGDRLLTAEKAAEILSVSPDWLYRRVDRLPFTRKLAPRVLRFSSQGIQKWLATRKAGQ